MLSRLPHKVFAPQCSLCWVVSKICHDVGFRLIVVTRCHLADILTAISKCFFAIFLLVKRDCINSFDMQIKCFYRLWH